MGDRPRILYVNHDNPSPAGGVRVIYRHVSLLVKNGYPAFVVHFKPENRPTWFKSDASVIFAADGLGLAPDDIIVIPEDHAQALNAFAAAPVTKFVFCQNHFYVFDGLGEGRNWADFGVSGVFCCSRVIQDFLTSVLGLPQAPVVPNSIDRSLFRPGEQSADGRIRIAVMPRKMARQLTFIHRLFIRLCPDADRVVWLAIDGVKEAQVAETLGRSTIFLSLSRYEGFGLPPVEAMACGNVVVGFHGYGGLEYATPENGYWCPEGDLVECARTLSRVVSLALKDGDELAKVRQAGLETAAGYSIEAQERALISFWEGVITARERG